jgi:2-haloacid dehalogenase
MWVPMKYEINLFDVDDTLFDFSVSEKMALSKTLLAFELPTGLADYHASYKEISRELWSDSEHGNAPFSEFGGRDLRDYSISVG